jgi:gp16 family phage-associated protein
MKLKTPTQFKAELARSGTSIASWACANGFSSQAVHNVLSGRSACVRGASHNIAVTAGLKAGRANVNAKAAHVQEVSA